MAGLNQASANVSKIFVIRENVTKYRYVDIFRLDIDNPTNLVAGKDFFLRNNDIVMVPPSQITQFNKLITSLLGGIFYGGTITSSPVVK
jgi:polysaccharide export outer membrane protein